MIRIKMILSTVLICFASMTNAQSGKLQGELVNTSKQINIQDTTEMVCFEVKAEITSIANDLNKKVLEKEIDEGFIRLTSDTTTNTLSISVNATEIDLPALKELLLKRGYILTEPTRIVETPEPSPIVSKERYMPEIDKFLNIEDTTIFSSKFERHDSLEIHPSRWRYYKVIEIIHDFAERLERCEMSTSISKIDNVAKQLEISPEAARLSLLEAARSEILTSEKYLDALLPYGNELTLLSDTQKGYYNDLIEKFNTLYVKINSD